MVEVCLVYRLSIDQNLLKLVVTTSVVFGFIAFNFLFSIEVLFCSFFILLVKFCNCLEQFYFADWRHTWMETPALSDPSIFNNQRSLCWPYSTGPSFAYWTLLPTPEDIPLMDGN